MGVTTAARPTFICGAGRSGTTLLVDMMGLHPSLSPIYETSFVAFILQALSGAVAEEREQKIRTIVDEWTRPLPIRPHHKREHERYIHGPHHILFERAFAMEATETFLAKLRACPDDKQTLTRELCMTLFERHRQLDGKARWINKFPAYVHTLDELSEVFPDLQLLHCVRDGRDVACSVLTRPWGPKTVPEAAVWWSEAIRKGRAFGERHRDAYVGSHPS